MLFTIFGIGHPMLMSRMSKGSSASCVAAIAMVSGSGPNSCIETGCSFSEILINSRVFLFPYFTALALTISIQTRAAPISWQRILKG